jgi:putative lipoic acid-binding regulatory protein
MSEDTAPALLEFPCDFPIKILAEAQGDWALGILAVVEDHVPDFDRASATKRPSRNGKYGALTCTIRARSRAQLDALYRDLTGHPGVKVVL